MTRISRFLVTLCCCMGAGTALATSGERVFAFTYEILAADLPAHVPVDLYLPLPRMGDGQRILSESITAAVPGRRESEPVYGNRYYHIHRPAGDATPLTAKLSWTVARAQRVADGTPRLAPDEEARFLAPNARVPVGHAVLDPILAEIRAARASASAADTARAIYDWVVDNVEYKKVGEGWGNGDTFWACSERYGNCTDFHALFISLARTEGIPARFEIGFPVPAGHSSASIGGYHCWVTFFLPGRGWVPIDASEAAKHPARREVFYGTHPADRIQFTTGRDLVLSDASRARPLNYFVYPYVEVGGRAWQGTVPTRFSYTTPDTAAQSGHARLSGAFIDTGQ